jgi:hypothetical protein
VITVLFRSLDTGPTFDILFQNSNSWFTDLLGWKHELFVDVLHIFQWISPLLICRDAAVTWEKKIHASQGK